MMNKYITLLILSFAVLFYSCDRELELEPNDSVSLEFDKLEDFELTLNGVYSSFTAASYYGELKLAMEAWAGDDLKISPQNNGQGAFIHHWNYTSGDQNTEAIWGRIYTTIFRANLIINNYEGLTPEDDMEAQRLNEIVSQAYGLRALAHFHAYMFFGERYNDGSELAVPFVTEIGIEQNPPRVTTNELFGQLKSDLNQAIELANPNFQVKTFGPAAMYTVLAHIALFERDWNGVVTHVNNALDAGAPGLADASTYLSMWNVQDIDGGENIFKINFEPTNARIGNIFYIPSLDVGYYWVTDDLLQLYDQDNDVRFEAFFDLSDFPRVIKYVGSPPANPNVADAKVYRTSELYLMRAEANYELGNDGDALADLDAVRSARIEGFSSPGETGGDLFDAIVTERRKELAFESRRFFDMRRWNMPIDRIDCTANSCFLENDNHRFVFPIPEAEVFANDEMVQNPGY